MNWKQTIGLFLNDDGGVVCNAFFAFLIVFSCCNGCSIAVRLACVMGRWHHYV